MAPPMLKPGRFRELFADETGCPVLDPGRKHVKRGQPRLCRLQGLCKHPAGIGAHHPVHRLDPRRWFYEVAVGGNAPLVEETLIQIAAFTKSKRRSAAEGRSVLQGPPGQEQSAPRCRHLGHYDAWASSVAQIDRQVMAAIAKMDEKAASGQLSFHRLTGLLCTIPGIASLAATI